MTTLIRRHPIPLTLALLLTLLPAACDRQAPPDEGDPPVNAAAQHDPAGSFLTADGETALELPQSVRDNLGVTFRKAESRAVRRTLRVPGAFELKPEARRSYHATLPGRVELLVKQLESVKANQLIARIDSPDWTRLRHAGVEAEGEIRLAEARIDVAKAVRQETQKQITFTEKRVAELSLAGTRKVELEAQLAQLRNKLPRLDAELNARMVELDEAREHFDSQLSVMASVTGLTVDALRQSTNGGSPVWRTSLRIEVRATAPGIVDQLHVTQGGWAEAGGGLLVTTDPTVVRFHAHAPQTDIGRFRTGQPGRVAPPGSVERDGDTANDVTGDVQVGFRAHPEQRTIPLLLDANDLPSWAKPGVSAFLEVVVDGDEQPTAAIPQEAVVRDGLKRVVFRRHGKNHIVRVEPELGMSDGRWVEVHKGVKVGDEVMINGAYAINLAQSNRPAAPEGYHYHADGSLHKDH